MSKVYLELTDLLNFSRSNSIPTGIQRLQIELAKKAANNPDFELVVFFKDRIRLIPRSIFLLEDSSEILLNLRAFDKSLYFRIKKRNVILKNKKNTRLIIINSLRFKFVKNLRRRIFRILQYYLLFSKPSKLLISGSRMLFTGSFWAGDINLYILLKEKFSFKIYVIIYDLIPIRNPLFFVGSLPKDFRDSLSILISHVDKFITISNSTKTDLIEFYKSNSVESTKAFNPISVPLAHEFNNINFSVSIAIRLLSSRKFVLCVGTIEIRKNISFLIEAWRFLEQSNSVNLPILVIAGKVGWLADDVLSALYFEMSRASKIRFIESPSDGDLHWLYTNCLFTVYSSHYEGWGLPIGESLWHNKFCIAPRNSSIEEVGTSFCDYYESNNLESFLSCLTPYIDDHSKIDQKNELIERSKLRSWDDVAVEYYNILLGDVE